MFRLESTTPPTKKRHSARKQGREASQTASNATKSMQAFLRTSEELNVAFPTSTEGTNQMGNLNAENIEQVFTIQPESSTRNTSKQRHRRHHRRR